MSVNAVPPGARLLHVGPPKTGTTAVQLAMHRSRGDLAAHGVHYAGAGSRPRSATLDLRHPPERRDGTWEALVAEVRAASDQRVCISSESLSLLHAEQAAEGVRALGGESVHVVLTARPIDALLPSMWQQRVRRLVGTPSYEDWLRAVLHGGSDDPHAAHFWHLHDLAGQLRTWTAAAAPERVTVIVAEEGNYQFLPDVFEDLLNLPRGTLAPGSQARNPSLNRVGGELLLQLDRTARDLGWDQDEYARTIRSDVANYLRSRARNAPGGKALPGWAAERAYEINTERADLLAAAGVQVIGDADSLRPDRRRIAVDDAPADLRLALDLAAGLAAAAADSARAGRDAELERARKRIAGLEGRLGTEQPRPAPLALVRAVGGRARRVLARRTG